MAERVAMNAYMQNTLMIGAQELRTELLDNQGFATLAAFQEYRVSDISDIARAIRRPGGGAEGIAVPFPVQKALEKAVCHARYLVIT